MDGATPKSRQASTNKEKANPNQPLWPGWRAFVRDLSTASNLIQLLVAFAALGALIGILCQGFQIAESNRIAGESAYYASEANRLTQLALMQAEQDRVDREKAATKTLALMQDQTSAMQGFAEATAIIVLMRKLASRNRPKRFLEYLIERSLLCFGGTSILSASPQLSSSVLRTRAASPLASLKRSMAGRSASCHRNLITAFRVSFRMQKFRPTNL